MPGVRSIPLTQRVRGIIAVSPKYSDQSGRTNGLGPRPDG